MSTAFKQNSSGFLGKYPESKTYQFMKMGDKVHRIYKVKVHQFTMGDVEDPILYAAQPLMDWQNSEQGQWVMEHAVETPEWHRFEDPVNWGHAFYITAKLKESDYSFYLLKWGK